jgi:hypothetical protein
MLTHTIDLSTWLEREEAKQKAAHGPKMHKRIEAAAAEAIEQFSEDELEEYAAKRNGRR